MTLYHITREDGSSFESESESSIQFLQESHPNWLVMAVGGVSEELKEKKRNPKKSTDG